MTTKNTLKKKIRCFVVEDSATVRTLLVHILSADPQIEVTGTAQDGKEAVEQLAKMDTDVVVMDINMPRMNGFHATQQIMETKPLPVVIVSAAWNPKETETTFRAMEAGAVAVLNKPEGPKNWGYQDQADRLVQTVKLMSEVKVVKRIRSRMGKESSAADKPGRSPALPPPPSRKISLVAIGASLGGPAVIQSILSALGPEFRLPILVIQHISDGFLEGMVNWLAQTSRFPTRIANHGQQILPGHAYFCRNGWHMGVSRSGRVQITPSEENSALSPTVSHLFRSVAASYGSEAVGILLTGMGMDGVDGLLMMKEQGAVTIAQDKESATAYGMPGEAFKSGAARYVLTPMEIAGYLGRLQP